MMRLSDAFQTHDREAPALWLEGKTYTYGDLLDLVAAFMTYGGRGQFVRVRQRDGVMAYARMLFALMSGGAYVPVPSNRKRAAKIHKAIGCCVPGDIAYLMFTSGSTGEPKGVPISHGNALAYVRYMAEHLGAGPGDRFTQMHDLTFDFSVHDIWVAWQAGACVYVVPKRQRMAPVAFLNEHRITHFAAVPSVLRSMWRLGLFEPGCLPHLRHAVFCGEALAAKYAEAFQNAAPGCTVENIYGPTEATVAITGYHWTHHSRKECRGGVVPIGRPFPGHRARVRDGELYLKGPQVARKYWKDPAETEAKFACGWYRTGDVVHEDADGLLHFVGRVDNQVQVMGHRVELGEVEAALRDEGYEAVCVQAADGYLVAFVLADSGRAAYDAKHKVPGVLPLPDYMVPRRVLPLDSFPLTANGKVDRAALKGML